MARPTLTSAEARQNIARLVRLASIDGYLDVTMTMRLLERSQIMAYTYLRTMVRHGLVAPDRQRHRWYLSNDPSRLSALLDADQPEVKRRSRPPRVEGVESEDDYLQPVRLFTKAQSYSTMTEEPATWVTPLFFTIEPKRRR